MKIKDWAQKNGLGLSELARRLQISKQRLDGYFKEKMSPNLSTLWRIMIITEGEVKLEDFLTEDEKNLKIEKITRKEIRIK